MNLKKTICIGALSSLVLSLASCSKKNPTDKNTTYIEYASISSDNDYDIYESILHDFEKTYLSAKEIKEDNKRFVEMARAEAKLLSSGVILPTTTQGGTYGLTRVAPRTAPYALWGNDAQRYKNLVVTEEIIEKEDYDTLYQAWENRTDSYDPISYATKYLTERDYQLKNNLTLQYTEGTKTFDYLATSQSADTKVLTNIADGLIEYNGNHELVSALAKEVDGRLYEKTIDEHGNATYTFTIKDNLYWCKNDGTLSTYPITATDFVTGFQHMLDAEGGLEYLASGVILGAREYLNGTITDFNEVGVKANGTQVQYTVLGDPSYFPTYLTYNIYQPLNKEFFLEQGGALGRLQFKEASSSNRYTYGKTKDSVLSCGAYYIKKYADQSELVFEANPGYWEDINISQIKWLYNDGKDALRGYTWFKSGNISQLDLNTTSLTQAKNDGLHQKYAYITDPGANTFLLGYNLNRQTYVLANGGVETAKSKEQARDTHLAIQNKNFRLALSYAFDKANWNAQSVGEELSYASLRNSYIPYNFIRLNQDVQMESETYTKGTLYGELLQEFCNQEGLKIDVSEGVNGWYHPTEAKLRMEDAIEELKEIVEISKENKIHLDIVYYSASESQTKQANSYKNSIEQVLGDYVSIDLTSATTPEDYYASGYRASSGAAGNFDVFYGSGWGPDYGDPSTFLDTFLSEGAGYMTKIIGLW